MKGLAGRMPIRLSGAPDERPRQASRAAGALGRNLPSFIGPDLDPGLGKDFLSPGIAGQGDALPRRHSEDVAAHRGIFRLRDFEELKAQLEEPLPEWNGQQP
jgi:hypothetical protein